MNKIETLVMVLEVRLRGESYVTAEALSEQLKETRADVQRALQILGTRGWSVRPRNHLAYGRSFRKGPVMNRGRRKGEPYDHDPHEPYWARTTYAVRPPRAA